MMRSWGRRRAADANDIELRLDYRRADGILIAFVAMLAIASSRQLEQ